MNKNYYHYIEDINNLNVLEKITYELVHFLESEYFSQLYQEEVESQKESDMVDSTIRIAKKFNVTVSVVQANEDIGATHEREHTKNDNLAREIARDHLWEDLYYYQKLAKIED